ncbi:MAG TPA: hypothetical protein PKE06_27575 [Flavilitoribacter sp.]|nr:hypothetical protein [Flavilitoribacter sp.]HMQ90854.1 hypothetical protein [Flavilitoribacter sp.]
MKTGAKVLLVLLLLLNASGAIFGGIRLVTDASGQSLGMNTGLLAGSPFRDFLIPGIILLIFNGLLPMLAAVGLLLKRTRRPLAVLPIWKDRQWGWTLTLLSGIALIVWILVQVALIGYWKELIFQPLYFAAGIGIILLACLPGLKDEYKI